MADTLPPTQQPDAAIAFLQMRLDAIASGMQETLFRTAVSPVVREGADASCALFTAQGELLALSDAIPLLLGALPGAVSAILKRYPAQDMQPGDMFLMNDPFNGGTHLPDIVVLLPVFSGPARVGFAVSILHQQDVGGMRAGSVPPDATDIFQEGLRLGPTRFGRAYQWLAEVQDLIRLNSRAPETVIGDINAQIAAARSAAKALALMAQEAGPDAFIAQTMACLAAAEAQTCAVLSGLTPGRYTAQDALDPTPGLPPLSVTVAVTVAKDRFTADFTGSADQVAAPVNCVRAGPASAVLYALLSLAPASLLRNGGVLRRIELILPEASIVNARAPAPVNARMGMVRCITSAVLRALSQAAPDQMPAANSGMSYVIAFSGSWPDGRPFVTTEIIAGGAGGGPRQPGASAVSTDVGNARNMPAEALEAIAPLRLLRAQIRRGSGGEGLWRGGDGALRDYLALTDGIAVSLRGDRFIHVPQGAQGGGAPKPSRATVVRKTGEQEPLSSRSVTRLNTGDRLIVESCGGAGYGVPNA